MRFALHISRELKTAEDKKKGEQDRINLTHLQFVVNTQYEKKLPPHDNYRLTEEEEKYLSHPEPLQRRRKGYVWTSDITNLELTRRRAKKTRNKEREEGRSRKANNRGRFT